MERETEGGAPFWKRPEFLIGSALSLGSWSAERLRMVAPWVTVALALWVTWRAWRSPLPVVRIAVGVVTVLLTFSLALSVLTADRVPEQPAGHGHLAVTLDVRNMSRNPDSTWETETEAALGETVEWQLRVLNGGSSVAREVIARLLAPPTFRSSIARCGGAAGHKTFVK